MTPRFADAFYYLAIVNPRDQAHQRVKAQASLLGLGNVSIAGSMSITGAGLVTDLTAMLDVSFGSSVGLSFNVTGVFDLNTGSTATNAPDGTLVQLYQCNGTNAQLWNPAAIGTVTTSSGSSSSGSGSSTGSSCNPNAWVYLGSNANACDGNTPALGPAPPACGDASVALWASLIRRRLFAAPPRCRGAE